MTPAAKARLRAFIEKSCRDVGDEGSISETDSLFASGRLDSLSVTRLVLFLESECDINFANVDFDVDMIDSINEIEAFVDAEMAN